MREINVVLNFNGEIVTGTLRVRADYLATEHDRTRLRNLLECNAQVLKLEEVQ
jgi:hypothetical protein